MSKNVINNTVKAKNKNSFQTTTMISFSFII